MQQTPWVSEGISPRISCPKYKYRYQPFAGIQQTCSTSPILCVLIQTAAFQTTGCCLMFLVDGMLL
jgi:hypothetical protein